MERDDALDQPVLPKAGVGLRVDDAAANDAAGAGGRRKGAVNWAACDRLTATPGKRGCHRCML